MFSIPAGKKLVVEFRLVDDAIVPGPLPPTVDPAPTDPVEPLPPSGYDSTTAGLLLEGFNHTLDAVGEPDYVALAPLGWTFGYGAPIEGFERYNSCYQWSGAIIPPEDGEYTFHGEVKSGGFVVLDGEIMWNEDREQDPGGHDIWRFQFTKTLVRNRPCQLRCAMVKQGGEHIFALKWSRPGKDSPETIGRLFCRPPAGWQDRVKGFQPPPPDPGPFAQVDWATYQSPEVPLRFFPDESPWNQRIDQELADPLSERIIAALGTAHLHPVFGQGGVGMPYEIVAPGTAKSFVQFDYAGESDQGPYPIPAHPVVEGGGGDKHWLGVSPEESTLFELFLVGKTGPQWTAGSGAIFPTNQVFDRPLGWTSADAAGLPILPGLVRYDEVLAGEINHALRVSVGKTRRAIVHPARHWASVELGEQYAPMGARLRLRASVDVSGAPAQTRPILVALQRYGAFVADNGSPAFIGLCGAPDARWRDADLAWMKRLVAADFEIVAMNGIVTEI